MDARQILKSSALFKEFNSLEILKVTEIARRRFLSKGDVIISEGENFDMDASLYIIASGLVKVGMPLGDGKELVLSILRAPDQFGEISFVDKMPRSANVTALEDSELLKLDHEDLNDLLSSDSGLALKFYSSLSLVLAYKLREMNDKLQNNKFIR